MKAIVFAAGLGTRLKPITDNCPKALVLLAGKPLIWHTINYLKKNGIDEVIVNVHHHSELLKKYILENNLEIPVHISDESDQLLDTGGGLLKARPFFNTNEPFVAINVDVITSLNLKQVITCHQQEAPLATLVVRKRQTNRQFLFDPNNQLSGWRNYETGEEKISRQDYTNTKPLAFSGIHVISPLIFDLISEKGKFSIVETYLRLAQNHKIYGYEDFSDFWLDLGKPGQISIAEEYLSGIK